MELLKAGVKGQPSPSPANHLSHPWVVETLIPTLAGVPFNLVLCDLKMPSQNGALPTNRIVLP
jgi:hypothetical protein